MNLIEEANKIIQEAEEYMDIADIIEYREKRDTGIRYTLEEVKKTISQKNEERHKHL